jgi:methionyl-tRNA formyltransferase
VPSLIIASPDKPVGRKKELQPQPTKIWAEEHTISCIQPENFKEIPPELEEGVWDAFIVVYYSKILPKRVLDIPERGTLNLHPSLLPKLRGPSPIKTAILEDMREAGVTIIELDPEMDHGPILAQARVEIPTEDWPVTGSTLRELLSNVGADLLIETIPQWLNNAILPEEQDHEKATFTKKITKEDGLINLDDDHYKNYLKIQAFDEWPGTYFFIEKDGKKVRVKITEAEYKDKKLTIKRVILEGKKEMAYKDLIRGV